MQAGFCIILPEFEMCQHSLETLSNTKMSHSSVVSIVTTLWAGESGVQILVKERDSSLLKNI
jgi:hypothetical protein